MIKVARANFKGPSQEGHHRVDFAKNLCVAFFNDDLANDTTFSQIYLDGQYLLHWFHQQTTAFH
jgi:hypothetical protein